MNIPSTYNRFYFKSLLVITILITNNFSSFATKLDCYEKTSLHSQQELLVYTDHSSIYCLDEFDAQNFPKPVELGGMPTSSFQEAIIELGCNFHGFSGYFTPSNWMATKIKGDGGVDVTGAPNAILVEGANSTLVKVALNEMAIFKIVIPAEGYVSFDWNLIGGSKFLKKDFSILINNQFTWSGENGASFFSDLLQPGDVFAIQLDGSQAAFDLQLDQFEFLTNAMGVLKREWISETHTQPIFQFVTIEKPSITEVVFPEDQQIVDNSQTTPEFTGYPVLDRDGDLLTRNDQYQLKKGECAFDLKWWDEPVNDSNGNYLLRHWTLNDWCAGNSMNKTQVIKYATTPLNLKDKSIAPAKGKRNTSF